MNRHNSQEIDETLKRMLEAYGKTAPQRKPEAEKRTRDRFLAELDNLTFGKVFPNRTSSTPGSIFMGLVSGLKQQKENLDMLFTQRSSKTIFTTILVLAVFLFGGGGITAYAAGAALPGDALYPVKTGIENARVGFAENPEVQARLFLGFAGNRLDEIRALVTERRFDNVKGTANLFEKDIQQALDAIQKLSEKDPARAAELSAEAAKILKGYSDSLSEFLAGVPQDVQPLIENALNASQSAVKTENGNSNINDDNSNLNSNSNTNDDNSNLNSNSNGNDDNSNLNSNSNTNGDDSSFNSNSNGNDDNNNLNSNSNSNSNDNGGGSGSGSNSNGNGGSGRNGGNGNDNGGSGSGSGGGGGNDDSGGGNGGGGG